MRIAPSVSLCLGLLLAAPLCAQTIGSRLKQVEKRYNGVRTLTATFSQTYRFQGRKRPAETGELFLRRPGKMRWQYTQPAGKLFVTDSKEVYFYSPATNRVEKSKMKESADYRTPLAFLLGKLDFNRDFKEFRSTQEVSNLRIVAIPKSGKSPYRDIEFVLTPENVITEVKVAGQDGSLMQFDFSHERLNVPVAESLFNFKAPPGAEVVELSDTDTGGSEED